MKDCSIVLIKAPFEVLHQELNDCVEYNRKHNPVYCFDKAVKKTFCKKVLSLISTHFVPGVYSTEKTRRRLETEIKDDDVNRLTYTCTYALGVLVNVQTRCECPILLSDLPTCRHLFSLKTEDLKEEIKKLSKSISFKQIVNAGAMAGDALESIVLWKMFEYYQNIIDELEKIQIAGWQLSEWEQWLLNKAYAERRYCIFTMIKAGLKLAKNVIDILGDSKSENYVAHYESKEQNDERLPLAVCPIMRNEDMSQ